MPLKININFSNVVLNHVCSVLVDSVSGGSSTLDRLYPVAVLPLDFRDRAGELVNQMTSDPGQWQFVRRFFLAEDVTNGPRYARSITLM